MKKYLYPIVFNLVISPVAWSAISVDLSLEELQKLQNQNRQGEGCAQTMFQQVGDNLTSQYEVQQQVSNNLMGVADAYFELRKSCENNMFARLDKWKEEKLRHQQEINKINTKMRANEIAFKKALLEVKRQCTETGNERFAAMKAQASSGVLNDVSQLVDRTPTLNKFQKLYYDNCMADPLTVEAVQISAMEMKANVLALQDELKASADTVISTEDRLSSEQELINKQCIRGKEEANYRAAIVQNQNAAAQSLTKKQNLFGLLNASFTCLEGNTPTSNLFAPRAPTSANK